MTARKTTFDKILDVPASATILGTKIIGRVIDQIARGYDEDESLPHLISLYKAIQEKYPQDTITLPAMFKTMVRRTQNNTDEEFGSALASMSDEAKSLWTAEYGAEKQALLDAMPTITALFTASNADVKAWKELPAIGQWSLLFATEIALPQKISLYKGWAATDTAQGKVDTNAMRLQASAEAAIKPTFDIITKFLTKHEKELEMDAASGINVPTRTAQAA